MKGRAALLLVCAAAACQVRRAEFVASGDAGHTEDRPARTDSNGMSTDASGESAPGADVVAGCVPRPETCNGLDDDCDHLVDETFDLNTDPVNCGVCGATCRFANARVLCSLGRCRLDACLAMFVDLDRLEGNGCECEITGAVELCDSQDNNCNGTIDEGFDFATSVEHCGTCGRKCEFPRAAASCVRGMCQMGACEPGFVDLDGSPRNGCEYPCAPTNGGTEICDGKDNNCDGSVDESDSRVGMRCYPEGMAGCNLATALCSGGCAFGTWACLPGGLVCRGATVPKPDVCDGQDNNCDGRADEDYDLQNDPRWCGSCTRRCTLPNAVPGCSAGRCVIKSCLAGFVDLDKGADNGCEYACAPDGPEVCDGRDNDCDGRFDVDDSDLLFPTANFCVQVGECGKGPGGSPRYSEPTFPACIKPMGAPRPDWICNYPASVQLFAPNQVLGQETWCDGLDNDCDGSADEHAKIGDPCTDMGLGECKKTGVLRCQADRALSPACDTTGAPAPTPTDEVCDGKDNDCDGHVDEPWDTPPGPPFPTCGGGACRGVRDDLVHVTVTGKDYYIYRHEATRVDATAAEQGAKDARSCSRAGLRPWTLVTIAQARTACAAAGMRLCRVTRTTSCASTPIVEDEWGLACSAGLICAGGEARPYPYACTYDGAVCNGADRGAGDVAATAALPVCTTADLEPATPAADVAYDMSGNVAEWTEDCRGTLMDGSGRKAYTLRGGSYTNIAQALRCDFTSLVVAENFAFADTGFRCCSSCAPGLADCGPGRCVSLGTDSGNCGACGKACSGATTCQNGTCR